MVRTLSRSLVVVKSDWSLSEFSLSDSVTSWLPLSSTFVVFGCRCFDSIETPDITSTLFFHCMFRDFTGVSLPRRPSSLTRLSSLFTTSFLSFPFLFLCAEKVHRTTSPRANCSSLMSLFRDRNFFLLLAIFLVVVASPCSFSLSSVVSFSLISSSVSSVSVDAELFLASSFSHFSASFSLSVMFVVFRTRNENRLFTRSGWLVVAGWMLVGQRKGLNMFKTTVKRRCRYNSVIHIDSRCQ